MLTTLKTWHGIFGQIVPQLAISAGYKILTWGAWRDTWCTNCTDVEITLFATINDSNCTGPNSQRTRQTTSFGINVETLRTCCTWGFVAAKTTSKRTSLAVSSLHEVTSVAGGTSILGETALATNRTCHTLWWWRRVLICWQTVLPYTFCNNYRHNNEKDHWCEFGCIFHWNYKEFIKKQKNIIQKHKQNTKIQI